MVGVARHRGGLEELQRELGDALNCETGDVADPELPARLFGTYRPTAVVLNAGATPVIAPLDEHDWDTFSVNWNVDVRQAFHFVQQALRTPPPNGGVVVTMSSGAALTGSLGIRAYAAQAGITEEEFIERAGATATPDQVASHVLDVIADGSYSAPAYHLTSDGLRPLG